MQILQIMLNLICLILFVHHPNRVKDANGFDAFDNEWQLDLNITALQ